MAPDFTDAELLELATASDDTMIQALALSLLLARRRRQRASRQNATPGVSVAPSTLHVVDSTDEEEK